jgi:hypothetical protein
MTVQARFYVSQITKHASGKLTPNLAVTLLPVIRPHGAPGAEGNVDWAKYTPSGSIQLTVTPETSAHDWFESMLGKDVAITFDEVTE